MRALWFLRATIAAFGRQVCVLLTRSPVMDDVLPPFPLRCQHCDESIAFARSVNPAEHLGSGAPPDRALYCDPSGCIACDPEHHILHRPMPSILS